MKIPAMLPHTVELINRHDALTELCVRLQHADALALDIETINWWDRAAERVALVQLAFRENGQTHVAVIDTLTDIDLTPLRAPLELGLQPKAIHNASFDAIKLARHYQIATSPIYDTMLAARRSGEKRCSLKAQAEAHLGIQLDKTEQRSDWSRRPLSQEQLRYAALDAVCTLWLYEKQLSRGLRGDYELRARQEPPTDRLPFFAPNEVTAAAPSVIPPVVSPVMPPTARQEDALTASELGAAALALLGIVTELSGRYSPEQLAVSVGSERIGLAGWIIDRTLGAEADLDETSAKQALASLCESGLVRISLSRRLEATDEGATRWRDTKRA